jgi:hypothetical protein
VEEEGHVVCSAISSAALVSRREDSWSRSSVMWRCYATSVCSRESSDARIAASKD